MAFGFSPSLSGCGAVYIPSICLALFIAWFSLGYVVPVGESPFRDWHKLLILQAIVDTQESWNTTRQSDIFGKGTLFVL